MAKEVGQMNGNVLGSVGEFRRAYLGGLRRILQDGMASRDLGAFVLVCANAYSSEWLLAELRSDIEGYLGRSASDDEVVFNKIASLGLDRIPLTMEKSIGDWIVQFNTIRAFRPRRSAGEAIKVIRKPYDPDKFNYNKVPNERIQGSYSYTGKEFGLWYNKFPFAPLHMLIVPEPAERREQFADPDCAAWAWGFVRDHAHLAGLALGYNSYGAYASASHLHFHMFIEPRGLPVTRGCWAHNGGRRQYPIACSAFSSADEGQFRNWVSDKHRREVAYNLLYTPERVYCFARKFQGTEERSPEERAPWTSGFAFWELSGGMITTKIEDYDRLAPADVEKEFARVAL